MEVRAGERAIPAVVIGLALVSTGILVSSLAVFQATPAVPAPAVKCLEPTNGSSREVTLLPQGEETVRNGDSTNTSTLIHFCLDQSVDLVGAWNSSEPVGTFVVYAWEFPFALGCNPQYCFARNGTFETTLLPGSYILGFLTESWANVTVNVTQRIELVFDRVTEMLQPAGPVYLPPGDSAEWQFSTPSGARNVMLGTTEVHLNFGFFAGLMNTSQFAAFQQNPSRLDFQGLSCATWSNAGEWGAIIGCSNLHWMPGNYTYVVWNSSPGNGVLQFDDPLFLAFNAS